MMCMVSHSRQRLFTNATSAERTTAKTKRQPPHDEDRSTAGRLRRRRRLSLKKFRCSTAAVYTRIRPPCPVESAGPTNTSQLQVRNGRQVVHISRRETIEGFPRRHRKFSSSSSFAVVVVLSRRRHRIAHGEATTRLLRIFAILCGGGGGVGLAMCPPCAVVAPRCVFPAWPRKTRCRRYFRLPVRNMMPPA